MIMFLLSELTMISYPPPLLQVVVVLQQVFQLIQKVLSKWLNDAQVVEVMLFPGDRGLKT